MISTLFSEENSVLYSVAGIQHFIQWIEFSTW